MTDLVLLTGASGFLAGHTALALLRQGYAVRGSMRNPARAEGIKAALQAAGAPIDRFEIVKLDLTSDAGWDQAMQGVRYLVHTAAPFALSMPADRMEMITPAVAGTERAIRSALANGVERIVTTSSTVAIAYGHPKSRTAPFGPQDWTNLNAEGINAYQEAKTRAEQKAWSMMDAAGRRRDLAVINPSGIIGPLLDDDPGVTSALIQGLINGTIPVMPKLPLPLVDVRDVAAAHVAAMTSGMAGGQRFPMVADVVRFKDLALAISAAFPQRSAKVPRHELPNWVVRAGALFNGQMRDLSREMDLSQGYDSSDVVRLLGRPLIDPATSAVATAESLWQRNLA